MRLLERRLQCLEALAASRYAPAALRDERQRAASALFDLLAIHYPDQGWVGTERRTSIRQAEEAAARVIAGEPSEVDMMALAAIEASDAIKVFSFTALELLAWFAEVDRCC